VDECKPLKPGIASEAVRGGGGGGLINSIVHMAASAPAVAKAAAVGVIGRARLSSVCLLVLLYSTNVPVYPPAIVACYHPPVCS